MAILDQTHPGGNERIHKIKTSGTRAGSEVTYFHNTLPYVSYIQEDQSGSESVHEKVDTAPAKLRQFQSYLPLAGPCVPAFKGVKLLIAHAVGIVKATSYMTKPDPKPTPEPHPIDPGYGK